MAGQGEIYNEDWITARLQLFEAITLPSMEKNLDEGFFWMIFIGANPSELVRNWTHENIEQLDNVYIIEEAWTGKNMNTFIKRNSTSKYIISCNIGDDDAWPVGFFATVINQAKAYLGSGIEYVGWTYSHGYEWVACDTVDLNFKKKDGFDIIIPEQLKMFNFPWLGHGIFVLQTKDKLFSGTGIGHSIKSEALVNEGFGIEVIEDPKPAWLYTRHQLADSGISMSLEKSIDFSIEDLEESFGIDSKKVKNWFTGEFSGKYCEKKAHRKGWIEMYDIPDTSNFIRRPFNSMNLEEGKFIIYPSKDFAVSGFCRLRIWDEVKKEYRILMTFDSENQMSIQLDRSILPKSGKCKFDIQEIRDGKFTRIMPYININYVP